ncbi:MAG: aspartate/glutamate racemase family protein [Proteobacteria bacterium]|nr:aspartate/glutamate racemase family protein [Pseudomonadota bacterium]
MAHSEATSRQHPARHAVGGKTVYGARVGILMMDTLFSRPLGDMGNVESWPFRALYRVVRGASPQWVYSTPEAQVFEAFAREADGLVAEGVDGLSICCGLMSLHQTQLARRTGVPVVTSSLLQGPLVQSLLPPGQRVGVVTISTRLLADKHLLAAGLAADTPVEGMLDTDELIQMRFRDDPWPMDVAAVEAGVLAAGERLVGRHPDIGAVVVECTLMPPYASALARHIGRPVFDIHTLLCWFHSGLAPRDFGHPGSAL